MIALYMDYQDFLAARKMVNAVCGFMETLPERKHTRPYYAIRGDLTDFLFHIYHHSLGGRAIACDLDFVEVRDGKIAALVELKKLGREMSQTQRLVTGTISRALSVPVYLVYVKDYKQFVVRKPDSHESLTLNPAEFHQFMQDFEPPF